MKKMGIIIGAIAVIGIVFAVGVWSGLIWISRPDNDGYFRGELIVGFEKALAPKEAKAILSKLGLRHKPITPQVNVSRIFWDETGEKQIVKVPKGKEAEWAEKLQQEKGIKHVTSRHDPRRLHVY